MVDHRMVGGGAGIDAQRLRVGEQAFGEIETQLHAGRGAGEALVIGDLPAPGGVAARSVMVAAIGGAVRASSRSIRAWPSAASAGRRRAARSLDRRIVDAWRCRRGLSSRSLRAPGSPSAPAAMSAGSRRRDERHRRDVLQPPALAAQLLALAGGHGAIEIVLRAARRARAARAHGGRRRRCGGRRAPAPRQRRRERALLGQRAAAAAAPASPDRGSR